MYKANRYAPFHLQWDLFVKIENNAWLTQAQIAELFGTKSQAITKHISNIYGTKELDKNSTCSILEQVRHEGNRSVKRNLAHYNLDVQKADAQYGGFTVKQFALSHDRFLIIDGGKEVYHIGASLKDLGKKWFAFSKLNKGTVANIINAISGLMQ